MNNNFVESSIAVNASKNSHFVCVGVGIVASIRNIPGDVDEVLGIVYKYSVLGAVAHGVSMAVRMLLKGSGLLNTTGALMLRIMVAIKEGLADMFYRQYHGSAFMNIAAKATVSSRIVRWLA